MVISDLVTFIWTEYTVDDVLIHNHLLHGVLFVGSLFFLHPRAVVQIEFGIFFSCDAVLFFFFLKEYNKDPQI